MSLARPFSLVRLTPSLLLTLLASSCAQGRGGFQMPPTPVEVADVQAQSITDRFHAVGTIEARENVKVVTEINAVVRQLPFAEGQNVAAGALIARLEDSDLKAEAARAEALRDQAKTHHQRVQQLFDQHAASEQELDDAGSALKVAAANFELARTRLAKTRIASPYTGVVGRRMVSPGAYLTVGQPITEVAAIDEMRITFSSPERYLSQLRRGAEVEITTTAYPGEIFRGTISVVDPLVDPVSRTVQIVARIPNRGHRLRPGMSADVTATLGERASALIVPDEAVFGEGDQNFVYVVKPDSTVTRQPVTLGARDSTRAEIVSGVKAGDRVVRAGYQKLFEGAHVRPVPSGGPGGAAAEAAGMPGAAGAAPAPAPKGGARSRGKGR
ncbi:MAG: efflux RND transporter periplasmic adaptor subunit [Candidatus Eisenbacteria bacterium]|uniref:Efflux RND transporter periplasmic adaptor subunit n=1 Tax=Eiseniibacteriota bacterium TaxID=2212470 RepID=A0A538U4Q3_UNCEI|nr:MAG: efflux RND transporter periplasmic adaptor subunit [Candidatus Eisenbacteria bacterium]